MSTLNYDPSKLKRELAPFYITSTDDEIQEMLKTLEVNSLEGLFSHIPSNVRFNSFSAESLKHFKYNDLVTHMEKLAAKNKIKTSFLGDGLKVTSKTEIAPYLCTLRNLVTAYTPYQPERSQGTLQTLWIYSSAMSMLTGFEAINASFYDRATALFEALNTGRRLKRKKTVLISEGVYPGDLKVIKTQAQETELEYLTVPLNPKTGRTDFSKLEELYQENKDHLAAFAFCQINCVGGLEDVNQLTDFCNTHNLSSIGVFDPLTLGKGGTILPSTWGSENQGCDMIVGEGAPLAGGPNFGGPGLGIFGIRYSQKNKNAIRSTAGRFVGKAKDAKGRDCLAMILSTREQHIRRDKATSNICSNQSFIATMAGAALLELGSQGLGKRLEKSRSMLGKFLNAAPGIALAFENQEFLNEITLRVETDLDTLIQKASDQEIQLGVNVSSRLSGGENLLLISFNDTHSDEDIEKLIHFFTREFKSSELTKAKISSPPKNESLWNKGEIHLKSFSVTELKDFYKKLDGQNVGPDDNIYPLGSCTMKYNPYINEHAADLSSFVKLHPQSPDEDSQGSLEILYQTQEMFKAITGLPGLTTQPVAGAQGELVGLKLFQAYHRDRGEGDKRNIILIPKSAHGTNPATATMAGYLTKKTTDGPIGIIEIGASDSGQIDFNDLKEKVEANRGRIAAIMVTNPNTSGVFEDRFRELSQLIHADGGLVYMDGANMNAIAGIVDLNKLGVDAVHNNLHKTWSIPHGGGGPGDAIVAVSEKLLDYLPGSQVRLENGSYSLFRAPKCIGDFHRHHGNFGHKVRCYTYLKALGAEGIKKMSEVAVLSSRYLNHLVRKTYPTLPPEERSSPRMHEFIITLTPESFERIENAGTPKAQAISKIGKLFLDFGLHAPTVAFPEQFGLMIEPTESFSKSELDRCAEVLKGIYMLVNEHPEVLTSAPHFCPISKVDEVGANKNIILSEKIETLPEVLTDKIAPEKLGEMKISEIVELIIKEHSTDSA